MKKKIVFTFLLLFSLMTNVCAAYSDKNVGNYETELAKFPCDY